MGPGKGPACSEELGLSSILKVPKSLGRVLFAFLLFDALESNRRVPR